MVRSPIFRCPGVATMDPPFALHAEVDHKDWRYGLEREGGEKERDIYTETGGGGGCRSLQDCVMHNPCVIEVTIICRIVQCGHYGLARVSCITCQVAVIVIRRTLGKRRAGSRRRKSQEGWMHSTKSRRNVKTVSLRHAVKACAHHTGHAQVRRQGPSRAPKLPKNPAMLVHVNCVMNHDSWSM